MPDERNIIDSSVVPAEKTLNLFLYADNKVYVDNGNEISNIKSTWSRAAICAAIIKKKEELRNKYGMIQEWSF